MTNKYEQALYDLFGRVTRYINTRPLNLGGYTTTSGGGGGPPGGFTGYLPQGRVAYDTTEAESLTIPVSGSSLVHNLNRIRYRIAQLEGTTYSGVDTDDVWQAKGDLLVGIGATIATILSVGNDGEFLSADSSTATGLKWTTVSGSSSSGSGTGNVMGISPSVTGDFVLFSGVDSTTIYDSGYNVSDVITVLGTPVKGDLIGGKTTDELEFYNIGTNGQILTADSAADLGFAWENAPSVTTDDIWQALGDLVVGTGIDTATRLAKGTTGQVLTVVSGAPTGLGWTEVSGSGSGDVSTDTIWEAKGDLAVGTGVDTATILGTGTEGQVLTVVPANESGLGWVTPSGSSGYSDGKLEIGIDGHGSVITTGVVTDFIVPYAMVVSDWTLLADVSGSIQIDLWKDTYGSYPPTDADSITGTDVPKLISNTKDTSSSLTGWTTSFAKDDIIRVNVDSVSAITRVVLSISYNRS